MVYFYSSAGRRLVKRQSPRNIETQTNLGSPLLGLPPGQRPRPFEMVYLSLCINPLEPSSIAYGPYRMVKSGIPDLDERLAVRVRSKLKKR